jgi:tetratricopeptide (TPR) repeat protein
MTRFILLSFFLLFVLFSNAQQERKYIRQGNREYKKAVIDSAHVDSTKYVKAESDYRKALDEEPNNWGAIYNLANSLYKQQKFEDASKQYMAAGGMENKNKSELAMAFHNLGNSYLQTNKLNEAIEAYKSALRNNPSDLETKYNLAWAQDKLKKQQEQQQKQDQDQDKQDKDKENQDKKEDQSQDQKSDEQKQDKNKQEQNQQQKQDQQKQQEQKQQQNQISKEDAMRLLEALQNDEKNVQEKVQKQKVQVKKRTTEKDW